MLGPLGIVDDLRVVFKQGSTVWGSALLYRFDRPYERAEVAAVAAAAQDFGQRVRLGILEDAAGKAIDAGPPGLARLVDREFVDVTPAAQVWLSTLAEEQRVAVATALVAPGGRSVTIVGSSGPVTVHATQHGDRTVIVERAGPSATGEVLMAAYDLTPRERDVVGLIAQGFTVNQIAARLDISEWTVKDHTKSINRKVGVGSRTELLATLFARHFAPNLAAGSLPGPRGYFTESTEDRDR